MGFEGKRRAREVRDLMEGKRRSDNAHQAAAEETPAMVETQSWRDRPGRAFRGAALPGTRRQGTGKVRPACYLTDEWGCPSGEPIIGIPF